MAGMYGCFKGRNSDGAAMASGPPDVMANQEPPEVQEECSGKKKSKFQTFKKFFARKKRKDPGAADVGLKASKSSDNVSKPSEKNNTLTRSEKENLTGSKVSLNSKALSHDSVFVSDSEANEALGASQDSIHGKVKSLQLQLKQAIRLGSPPSLMCVKRTEDAGTMSEDDGLPCSPPEYTTLHTVMSRAQGSSSISLEGIDSDDEQRFRAASSRAMSPLVVPVDFSQPASPFAVLDNSAAKHKMGLRHKACNKRKPVTRLELKSETDSAMGELVSTSKHEEEAASAQTDDGSSDQLTPEEEMDPTEEESGRSLLRAEEEEKEEEGEDESDGEQDVSHSSDTSCPLEQRIPEKENPDIQPLPSSSPSSSTASSPLTTRALLEPPAGHKEELSTPSSDSCGAEEPPPQSDFTSGEEEDYEAQENKEEENSFLQEVLSSLQSPLSPSSQDLKVKAVVPEVKQEEEEQMDKMDLGDGEDVKEDNAEEEENESALLSFVSSDNPPEEKEELVSSSSEVEEEDEMEKESKQTEDAEEEPLTQLHEKEEEKEEEEEKVVPIPLSSLKSNTKQVVEEEADESLEEENEAGEEERWEKREEYEEDKEDDGMDIMGQDDDDEAPQMILKDEEVHSPSLGENKEKSILTPNIPHGEELPTELSSPLHPMEQEEDGYFHQDEGKEKVPLMAEKPAQKHEPKEVNQYDTDESGELVEQDSQIITTNTNMKPVEKDSREEASEPQASSGACPVPIQESHNETPSLERRPSSPSKTSTVQINLSSPSSERAQPFSLFCLTDTDPQESLLPESPCDGEDFKEPCPAEGEEQADTVEESQQAAPPAGTEEVLIPLPCRSDPSKARFTISPAWQRSQSLSPPPSSPPPCISSPSAVFEAAVDDASGNISDLKDEPTDSPKAEPVWSPSRASPATSITANDKLGMVKPQPTEESAVSVEGNPDNPFGVRLRKTSALIRFNSEEENVEDTLVSPTPSPTCKADPPQPISVKPVMSQLNSSKPAIPKKPDITGDAAGKVKRISDPTAGRGLSATPESPSWISVAKQKQRIYKENSMDEVTIKKETREEQEEKSSMPTSVSPTTSRDYSIKPVSPVESIKPPPFVEKDQKKPLPPPTPVPPQHHPCTTAPKPQLPPALVKPPTRAHLSPPTPVPVPPKSPLCPSPPALLETVVTPQTLNVTSPPFSTRTAIEKSAPGQTPSSQRGLTSPALTQDEPPWMALAKKKAKAWSEMPQIVQ